MYDITLLAQDNLPFYPGERGFRLYHMKTIEQDGANVSWIDSSLHTGTHIDTPLHFIAGGTDSATTSLTKYCGPARVFTLNCAEKVTAQDAEALDFEPGDIVLFNIVKNQSILYEPEFRMDYVYVSIEAAEVLVRRGAKAVGINYFSVAEGTPKGVPNAHHVLLGNNVVVIEGIDLGAVPDGRYILFALPLKIAQGNGSPVRAVLFEPEELGKMAQ